MANSSQKQTLTVHILGAVLLTSALASNSARAGRLDEVYIKNLSYGGPGCPQGSVDNLLAMDRTSFSLIFDDFTAEIGPDVPRREARSFCQVALELHVPQGWSYAVSRFYQAGWADLDQGVSATLASTYYFSHDQEVSKESLIRGPVRGVFSAVDELAQEQLVWSECGESAIFNIKPQVTLRSRSSYDQGMVGTWFLAGKIKTQLGLMWRQCR